MLEKTSRSMSTQNDSMGCHLRERASRAGRCTRGWWGGGNRQTPIHPSIHPSIHPLMTPPTSIKKHKTRDFDANIESPMTPTITRSQKPLFRTRSYVLCLVSLFSPCRRPTVRNERKRSQLLQSFRLSGPELPVKTTPEEANRCACAVVWRCVENALMPSVVTYYSCPLPPPRRTSSASSWVVVGRTLLVQEKRMTRRLREVGIGAQMS